MFEVYRKVFHSAWENHHRQLSDTASELPEETPVTVKMGTKTCVIYVQEGVIYARLATIGKYLGYSISPTHLLHKWDSSYNIKVKIGAQENWFINARAFAEIVKYKGDVGFYTAREVYKDVFRIEQESDENPYTFMFTDGEMLDIISAVNQKPIYKNKVTNMLLAGKKGGQL